MKCKIVAGFGIAHGSMVMCQVKIGIPVMISRGSSVLPGISRQSTRAIWRLTGLLSCVLCSDNNKIIRSAAFQCQMCQFEI